MPSSAKWLFKLFSLVILASLLFPCPAFCQQQGDKQVTGETGWHQLALAKTTIEGVTVYYEKALEPNLPVFAGEYRKFLADRAKANEIITNKQEILDDINRILGVVDLNTEMQTKMLIVVSGAFSQAKPTFYLVTRPTIKSFLKSGGRLPDFTYDRAADMAFYLPHWSVTSDGGPLKEFELTLPIAPDKDFAEQVAGILGILKGSGSGPGLIGVAIHEVTEITLIEHAKPTDPYWRWFSDGFANAIAIEILKNRIGQDAANEFAKSFDVNKYKELEKEINLKYWSASQYCILPKNVPIVAENELDDARYRYATLEANRLIEKHGIDCVRKILDEISKRDSRKGSDLLDAIKKVTGEDMQERLKSYQSFATLEEAMAKYTKLFKEATSRSDYEGILVSLLRIHELRSPEKLVDFRDFMWDYEKVALQLFKSGHEKTADQVMDRCMEFGLALADGRARRPTLLEYIVYALDCLKPRKAQKVAEEMLKTWPDEVSALTVLMLVRLEDKQLVEAKEFARRICSLTEKELSPHKLALV